MKPAAQSMDRRSASGWCAPTQSGGWGRWSGFGSSAAFSSCQNSPANVTRGSVQRARMSRSPSLKRATRRAALMPKAG